MGANLNLNPLLDIKQLFILVLLDLSVCLVGLVLAYKSESSFLFCFHSVVNLPSGGVRKLGLFISQFLFDSNFFV